MVLPLRFPPGLADGLLLAYPRMENAGLLRRCNCVPCRLRNLFPLAQQNRQQSADGSVYPPSNRASCPHPANYMDAPTIEGEGGNAFDAHQNWKEQRCLVPLLSLIIL